MNAHVLQKQFPQIRFESGEAFVWSPKKQIVYYNPERLQTDRGITSLLHEVGHALLGHTTYELDIELLDMEAAAWSKARSLAQEYKVNLDHDHIDACLDTYRAWIYKRSRCPLCGNTSLQRSAQIYHCFLCNAQWNVAQSRSSQPRRMNCIVMDQAESSIKNE